MSEQIKATPAARALAAKIIFGEYDTERDMVEQAAKWIDDAFSPVVEPDPLASHPELPLS